MHTYSINTSVSNGLVTLPTNRAAFSASSPFLLNLVNNNTF